MRARPATRSRRVLAAQLRIGLPVEQERGGSHKMMERPGWPDFTWAFHDNEEIGPAMLSRIARCTGLTPRDL